MGPRDECSKPVPTAAQKYELCKPKEETQQPPVQEVTTLPQVGPNTLWWLLGAALLVVAIGSVFAYYRRER